MIMIIIIIIFFIIFTFFQLFVCHSFQLINQETIKSGGKKLHHLMYSLSFNLPVSLSCSTFSSSSKLSDFFSSSDSDRLASPYNTHTVLSFFLLLFFFSFIVEKITRTNFQNHSTECKNSEVCCIFGIFVAGGALCTCGTIDNRIG